jgi:hypothetical protein
MANKIVAHCVAQKRQTAPEYAVNAGFLPQRMLP